MVIFMLYLFYHSKKENFPKRKSDFLDNINKCTNNYWAFIFGMKFVSLNFKMWGEHLVMDEF